MKAYWLSGAAALTVACGRSPTEVSGASCADVGVPALTLIALDASSRQTIASQALVIARDGAYADTAGAIGTPPLYGMGRVTQRDFARLNAIRGLSCTTNARTQSTHSGLPLGLDMAQLIDRASEESARCQHEHIGTEHLVLALSRQDDAASPLLALGIDRQRLHMLLDATIQRVCSSKWCVEIVGRGYSGCQLSMAEGCGGFLCTGLSGERRAILNRRRTRQRERMFPGLCGVFGRFAPWLLTPRGKCPPQWS